MKVDFIKRKLSSTVGFELIPDTDFETSLLEALKNKTVSFHGPGDESPYFRFMFTDKRPKATDYDTDATKDA
jgi:hypothetical protein